MIFLYIGLPLIVAAVLPLVGKASKRFLPDVLANGVFLFLFAYAVTWGRGLLAGGALLQKFSWFGEPLGIALAVDGFSLFMLMVIALVSLCVGLYSINYMEHYGAKAEYYALLLMMTVGMNGLVLVADLFQVYLFLEVAAVASYALVAYGREHAELEAAFKYLMLSVVASAAVLIAIALLFGLTGSLGFAGVGEGLRQLEARAAAGVCAALFLLGFGLKAALVPFHAWLPDAHPSAPAPISAILSGLLIKVSGVYALTRVFFHVFGLSPALSDVMMWTGGLDRRRRAAGPGPDGHEADAGLLLDQPGRLRRPGDRPGHAAGHRRRPLPPAQPRRGQGPAVPELRRRPARAPGRATWTSWAGWPSACRSRRPPASSARSRSPACRRSAGSGASS